MQDDAEIKLGLVGTGAWGMNFLKAKAGASGVVLAHVASPHIADKTLPKDIVRHADWHDLLTLGLDGLIVATPPQSHAEISAAALDAGLAVLVEKPVTLSVTEAEHLRDLAVAQKGILQVGHIDLHNPAFRAMQDSLPARSEIARISGAWSNAGPWRNDASPLWDWGPHPLACCLTLAGFEFSDLQLETESDGQGQLYRLQADFEDIAVDLTFGNGDTRRQRWMEVESSGHIWRYDDASDIKASEDGRPLVFSTTPPLTAEIERLANAIRAGVSDTADADLGLAVVKMLRQLEQIAAS